MKCAVCSTLLGPRYVAFVRRVRRLIYQDQSGQPKVTEQILSADLQPAWCSIDCWEDMADPVISALQLTSPFPGSGPVVPCSRCGAPVDKTKAHVAYVVLDLEVKEAPWLTSGHVHWQRVLAVLCVNCEAPDGHSAGVARETPAAQVEVSATRQAHKAV
ncbi:MAG: hypothetical protein GX086_06345 [Alcaligenaceae bacterium]|nr:hypothetical protein [Alcaligenaceae bacterium]